MRGHKTIRRLAERGLYDARRRVLESGRALEIPLRRADESLLAWGEVVQQDHPSWVSRPPTPYEAIQRHAALPSALRPLLPRRWEKVGDVLLLRFPKALRGHQEVVCRAYATVLRVKAVLDVTSGVEGPWRKPRSELLWGESTETIHRENGVLFKLDLQKVMFSSGNVDERVRMAGVAREGEVIVDMFAGIGYFALPMAVRGRARRIYACEVNPVAYGYLVENVRLNGAANVVPLLGDCRDVAPEGMADRVVLGYLRDTHAFLPKALRTLRGRGWVHYHEACPDVWSDRLRRHLREAAASQGWQAQKARLRQVKSYAPGVSHWVVDALMAPEGTPPSRSP